VSNTAICFAVENTASEISIPVKFAGLCSGAKSDNSLMFCFTASLIKTVFVNLLPP